MPAGVHPRALGSPCAKCCAPFSPHAGAQSVGPLAWRLPPLFVQRSHSPTRVAGAALQFRSRRTPSRFFWTKKAVEKGEEGKCPGADGRLCSLSESAHLPSASESTYRRYSVPDTGGAAPGDSPPGVCVCVSVSVSLHPFSLSSTPLPPRNSHHIRKLITKLEKTSTRAFLAYFFLEFAHL